MINYKALKGGVDASITRAITSTGKAQQHIQHAAVSILIHTAQHGDWRKAVTLVEGLGDGTVRADSLVAYFAKFGLTQDEDTGEFNGSRGKAYIAEHLDKAKSTAWNTVKKAPNPYRGFHFEDAVRALIKTATAAHAAKASAELEDDKEKRAQILAQIDVTPDNIKALRKLIAA
mgnify:FL=1|tara:strand:- start:936 stop:1457 length:522 start_codon:yes stop_codon:yes gene_type:complete